MSASQPLLSIVVPTYNRAYCLARTLDSALGQTYRNLEVILVDDGSTDGTEALVAQRYASEPRLRYVRKKNAGVSAARNTGFAEVHGELVGLLDSDDVWHPWKAEVQIACMQAHPELVMTWTNMDAVDAAGTVTPAYLRRMYSAYSWFPTSEDLFAQSEPLATFAPSSSAIVGDRRLYFGDIFSQMILGNLVHTSTVILRRACLERVKGFREDFLNAGEDHNFHVRTCREGPVGYLDVSSIYYERGLTDHLANPKNGIFMARHYLATIAPIIENERHRLTLSDAVIRGVLAKAHGWVGQELFERGERASAFRELATSLRYEPWQPRTMMLMAAAPLPAPLRALARSGLQAIKRAIGAST
jgi:GT2 family glycosyltransferase